VGELCAQDLGLQVTLSGVTLFSVMTPENPFVFGEIIDDARFVDRTDELDQLVRDLAEFRFGPASSVQKTLQSLDARDILDRYRGEYFFLDPLLPCWIRTRTT